MRKPRRYDYDYPAREGGYGAGHRSRYGREYRPLRGYGREYGRYFTPRPGTHGFPAARWGWNPIGWTAWGPGMEYWPALDTTEYGFDGSFATPRRRPEESPTYGSRADRAVQRWAEQRGYDTAFEIRPRSRRRR